MLCALARASKWGTSAKRNGEVHHINDTGIGIFVRQRTMNHMLHTGKNMASRLKGGGLNLEYSFSAPIKATDRGALPITAT